MVITFVNGVPRNHVTDLENCLHELAAVLQSEGHDVRIFDLRHLNINYCTGCFNCWVKTPGVCIFEDDMSVLLNTYLTSDVAVFVSPVLVGFVSGLLKQVVERLLPLFHPHLTIQNNLFHHSHRYKKIPKLVLLLAKDRETTDVEVSIIKQVFEGMNLNLSSIKIINESIHEIAYEINHI
jgi:multimeric flavodoxin WrbA